MSDLALLKQTPEQQAVIEHIIAASKGSLNVDALAGAAKSSTLRMAAEHITGQALALAFNVAIKEELASKLPENFTVLTLNGLGHRAWMKFSPRKVNLKGYKTNIVIKELFPSLETKRKHLLNDAVTAAKAHGLFPADSGTKLASKTFIPDTEEGWQQLANVADFELDETLISQARAVLKGSIVAAIETGLIDFADQLYLPSCLGATFPRYPMIFVDEAQDLSPLNHYMVQQVGRGSKVIGVGDERQSIYAFRGADANSISKLRSTFQMDVLNLSTTFRCAKALVRNVHWRAPAMQAAPWAPEGIIETLQAWGLRDILPNSAVICRNNAPLFSIGFAMLKAHIPVTFMGKGIEAGMTSIILKASGTDPTCSAAQLASGIEHWREQELAKATALGDDNKQDRINDQADAILSIPGDTVGQVLENMKILLNSDDGSITLCTGHKSKGLEFDTVYHFEPQLIGRGQNLTPTQKLQEDNLRYVIDTRAKTRLVYLHRKGWVK